MRHFLPVISAVLLLTACAPVAETKTDIRGSEAKASGPEGWAVFATAPFSETHWDRDRPTDDWRIDAQNLVAGTRTRWALESEEHGTVDLELVSWPEATEWGPHAPSELLTPGAWTINGYVDDVLIVSSSHAVNASGQDPDHDPGFEDDMLFELPNGLGVVGGPALSSAILGASLLVQLTDRADGSFQTATLYSADEQAVCRVWSGPIEHDASGMVTADVGDIVAGGEVELRDVHLRFGLNLKWLILDGLAVDLAFDGRDLDPLVAPANTEPVEGAFCETISRFDFACQECDDGTGPYCSELHSYSGNGSAVSDAVILNRYADYSSLDDVPPCVEPEDGSFALFNFTCSTVGTTGVAAWMVGLVLIGVRRRGRRPSQRA